MQKVTISRLLNEASLFYRYGGISVGGRLPILDVDPEEIQNIFSQLGRMMNIKGV